MDSVLKLILIDSNPNDADRILNTIKSSGLALRSNVVTSEEELAKILQDKFAPHVVLLSHESTSLTVEKTSSLLQKYGSAAPIILLFEGDISCVASLYRCGIARFVEKEDKDHLTDEVSRLFETRAHLEKLEQLAENYHELEQRCQSLLDSSRDAICYLHEGLHTYTNQSYLELFDISNPEEATGISFLEFVSGEDQAEIKDILIKVRKELCSGNLSLRIKLPSGDLEEKNVEYSPVVVDGETCIQIIIRTELVHSLELQEQLSYLSERDIQTGFYHRRSIFEKLDSAVTQANSSDETYTFLQVDIVNINELRDQHGLPAVDQLTAQIAESIRSQCSEENTIAKLTEDSFGILSPQHNTDQLREFARSIKTTLEKQSLAVGNESISAECYIGAVIIDGSVNDVNTVLAAAKSACDHAWENQSKDFELYEPDITDVGGTLLDQKWTRELQEAIDEDRFKLLFQPIISMAGDQHDRYQVYTQLISKEGAAISVAELLPSIERTGVSVLLDRWIIENSLQRLSKYYKQHNTGTFFVKLTSGSLRDEAMFAWVEAQMKKYNIPAERLVMEIQEEIIVSNLKETKELASKLQKVGCGISIDAFGLSNDKPTKILSLIPADYVKLSYRLIHGISENVPEHQERVNVICADLRDTPTKVIAQHIESAEMLSKIWPLGIELVSGEFFQVPTESLEYDFSSAA